MFSILLQNKYSTVAQIAFNTPGSKIDRAMSFDFNVNSKQKNVEVSLKSPWKRMEMKGKNHFHIQHEAGKW